MPSEHSIDLRNAYWGYICVPMPNIEKYWALYIKLAKGFEPISIFTQVCINDRSLFRIVPAMKSLC